MAKVIHGLHIDIYLPTEELGVGKESPDSVCTSYLLGKVEYDNNSLGRLNFSD